MTVTVLDRTQVQRLEALKAANEVRCDRARLKRAVAAGGVDVASLVAHPPEFVLTMKLAVLLGAVYGMGPARVRRLMRRAAVSDSKTLGGLSARQRVEIVRLLGEVSRAVAA